MPETEEKPDLDQLLDLLREPDEEPRPKRIPGSVWLMLALVLSMAGVWLAVKTATGELATKTASLPMKPTKSKDRSAREERAGEVNVVEDYLARCKKGMTAREVRWIVEDFQKAGLDHPPQGERIEKFVAVRLEQHRWYLELLTDGLALDAEQRRASSEKLWLLADEAAQKVVKALFEEDFSQDQLVEKKPEILEELIDAKQWLVGERYAPWELCELRDEQKRLTWYFYVMDRRSGEPGSWYDPELPWWDSEMCSKSDPEADEGWGIGDFPTGCAPDKIGAAGTVFPFVSSQEFSITRDGPAGPVEVQAMACHPSQLKTALLVDPAMAAPLLNQLDLADQ